MHELTAEANGEAAVGLATQLQHALNGPPGLIARKMVLGASLAG